MSPSFRILLSPPEMGPEERDALIEAFDSNWIAPAGPDLNAFEEELGDLTGAPAVAALSSGTDALRLLLIALEIGAGDDVLVNTLTFAASAFAVSHVGARPCFVDCREDDWHMDVGLLADELASRAREGRLPAAVVAVDLFGSVADWNHLRRTCDEYEVHLIADSAEALGARRDGVHAGRAALAGVLSFNGNKIVTTGGGGAAFSDDESLIDRVRHLGTQARQPVPWYEHREIGYNDRLGNLNAAVGRGQLKTLPRRIERRHAVRRHYERRLSSEGVAFQFVPDGCEPNYWLTNVVFGPGSGFDRDVVLAALRESGIEARHGFKPMHLQPVYEGFPVVGGAVAERVFERSVSLPSGANLTESDVEEICDVIEATRSDPGHPAPG